MLLAERWILAALRKRQFFSLAELNQAIAEMLDKLNRKRFRKLPGTRAELFEQLDRPALQLLPAQRYVFAEWAKQRVRLDYHVEIDSHHYSVPYSLVQQQVEIRSTASLVEVLYRGKRVASHARSSVRQGTTTDSSHQPKSHQRLRWSPAEAIEWATGVGEFTLRFVETVLAEQRHPESGFRAVAGLRPLAAQYGSQRLEAACTRALRYKLFRLDNVRSILATRLDQQLLPQLVTPAEPVTHGNIRGPGYYGDGVDAELQEVAG